MERLFAAAIFTERPTEIEYRDGLFWITDRYEGGVVFRRACRPHLFLASFHQAKAAVAKWSDDQSNICGFPRAASG